MNTQTSHGATDQPAAATVSGETKVRQIGGAMGVIIPKSVLTAAGMKEGDLISASLSQLGSGQVTLSIRS